MIGIFSDDTTRLPITYNGLTLNDPSAAPDDVYEINNVTYSVIADAVADPHQSRDGLEVGDARKLSMLIRIEGMIRAQSINALYDKIRVLVRTFDPAKISHENASDSFLALDFTTPGAAGSTPSRYYVRPRDIPTPPISEFNGLAAPFTLYLLARNPRRFKQAQDTLSGAGTAVNDGDYRTWPTLTITMTGAGSGTYAITNNPTLAGIPTKTLTLNLSGRSNGQVVVVDMERRKITVDGVETPSLFVSGDFFELEPGDNAITYANTTNATSQLAWRDAWCL